MNSGEMIDLKEGEKNTILNPQTDQDGQHACYPQGSVLMWEKHVHIVILIFIVNIHHGVVNS